MELEALCNKLSHAKHHRHSNDDELRILSLCSCASRPRKTFARLIQSRHNPDAMNSIKRAIARVLASDVLHYAIIPVIIIVGMNTTPKPSILSLLTPI